MNKTWIAVLIGALLVSLVGLGIQQISAHPGETQLTSAEVKEMIGEKYPGKITELELEREDGQHVYEVEIEGAQGEYELKLDATSGEILKLEEKDGRSARNDSGKSIADTADRSAANGAEWSGQTRESTLSNGSLANQTDENKGSAANESTYGARISLEEAKEIALKEVPGRIEEIELDEDDGLLIYEVEIETKNGEAEVEVNAHTGEIVMISLDD